MVYDTLYGVDTAFVVRPQMAAGHVVEDEGRRWTIVLRDGLVFHDGEKVRAQDVIASIGRWMKRNTFGQKLQSVTDELSAIDDRRIVFRLNRPFPLLLAALANPANPAFVLPERLARTDPYKPIQDATGSGPFRFKADEFNAGSFAAYERHTAYQPAAAGEPSLTAGPKIVYFDRVEWRSIPDPATAAAALQAYIHAVEDAEKRIALLVEQIEQLLGHWSMAPVVTAIQAMRGVAFINAITLVAEIGDFARFTNPRQLMAYVGLVPSEHSTGDSVRRGGITKAGNNQAR